MNHKAAICELHGLPNDASDDTIAEHHAHAMFAKGVIMGHPKHGAANAAPDDHKGMLTEAYGLDSNCSNETLGMAHEIAMSHKADCANDMDADDDDAEANQADAGPNASKNPYYPPGPHLAASFMPAGEAPNEKPPEPTPATDAAFANERAARKSLIWDKAITEGRVTQADLPAWESKFSANFETAANELANLPKKLKTAPITTNLGNKHSEIKSNHERLTSLMNEQISKGLTYDEAFLAVVKAHPEFAITPKK